MCKTKNMMRFLPLFILLVPSYAGANDENYDVYCFEYVRVRTPYDTEDWCSMPGETIDHCQTIRSQYISDESLVVLTECQVVEDC